MLDIALYADSTGCSHRDIHRPYYFVISELRLRNKTKKLNFTGTRQFDFTLNSTAKVILFNKSNKFSRKYFYNLDFLLKILLKFRILYQSQPYSTDFNIFQSPHNILIIKNFTNFASCNAPVVIKNAPAFYFF